MIKNKKILFTGACGFIGNNFTKLLLAQEPSEIVVIDKMTYVSDDSFHKSNGINVLEHDICSKEAYNAVLSFKPDIICHFAAESHVDRSIEDPDIFLQSNVFGTTNLMNAALKLSSIELFHFCSTDEIYGDITEGWSKETDPRKTSSPYSASKASAELFVEAYGRTFKLPYLITRSSNNYGPYQHTEKFIPKIVTNILQNKKIPVYGDGAQERDWIYVEDNCEAICKLINNVPYSVAPVFNIGGPKTYINLEIIAQICILMNKDPKDFIEFVKDRKGHDRRYAIDISKIKQNIDWKPKTSLNEGLKKTIEWYIERNK